MSTLVFDIGASRMRIAEVTDEGMGRVHRVATPQDPLRAIERLGGLVRESGIHAAHAYGGAPAVIGRDGTVIAATNLPRWNGVPFAHALSKVLGLPVGLRNDAELAGLGEALYGAGKGMATVAYFGLGTGVGTSCVREGAVVEGTSGGPVRESIIRLSGGGTLESRIGGRSVYLRLGVHPEELARPVWSKLTLLLAEGIEHAIAAWSPDVVVLGGSLMNEENGFRIKDIERALAVHAPHTLTTPIRAAALKDASGLYGAMGWAKRESAA